MMQRVLETRKAKLGREHAYTLLAMLNLALVKAALNQLVDAEAFILTGLPIAERNLGADHIAYLWGRCNLGKIWMKQERWIEAEALFVDVTERQKNTLQGRGRHHPDRIGGLVQLATVYNKLGKFDECDRVANEALDALDFMSTTKHPIATELIANQESWKRERQEVAP
ncbi:hypothetical protein LTR37_008123 [Vermiconidia calcicola]|uniref:Uncharacterized protein n=1 Tax=Vermiconidia calcicola TaxID=1690605 RepID=A0ACC3NBV2_9PEZI|nr:hypothetical protein LTR37_008123 [Vermiconidia calcicola]